MFRISNFGGNVGKESIETALSAVDVTRLLRSLIEDVIEGELTPVLIVLGYFIFHHSIFIITFYKVSI